MIRLPGFVTAESIAAQLGWVNSINRQVTHAANQLGIADWNGTHGDQRFYHNIVRLLGTPKGGKRLQDLVVLADPKDRRGLSRAVLRNTAAALHIRSPSVGQYADYVARLMEKDATLLAAWLIFDALSYWDPGSDDERLVGLVELIEANTDLQMELGAYWADWRGGTHAAIVPTTRPDDQDDWTQTLIALGAMLDVAHPFDSAFVAELRNKADALDSLIVRHDKSRQAALQEAAGRDAEIARLRTAAALLPQTQEWTQSLRAVLVSADLSHTAREDLAAAAAWLEESGEALATVEAQAADAAGRFMTDDSDDNLNELKAARDGRRKEHAEREAESGAWIARLERRAVADPAGAQRFEPANVIKMDVVEVAAPPLERQVLTEVVVKASEAPAPTSPMIAPAPVTHPAGSSPGVTSHAPVGAPAESALVSATTAFPPLSVVVDPAIPIAETLASQALRTGRYGLAVHLARAAETLGAISLVGAGSAMLTALCIGEALDEVRRGPVETHYKRLLPRILEEIEGVRTHSRPLALSALAGALRPALFLPYSGAAEVIRKADLGRLGSELHRLSEFIVLALPRRGAALDLLQVAPAADLQTLKEEVARARLGVLRIADAAPTRTAVFARASFIWRELFKKAPVSEAVKALRAEAPNVAAAMEEAATWLERSDRAEALDREIRSRRDEPLEGKASEWLRSSLAELVL